MLIRLLLVLLLFSCSSETYQWFDGTLDEALSSAEEANKIILLDFYSDG